MFLSQKVKIPGEKKKKKKTSMDFKQYKSVLWSFSPNKDASAFVE